MKETRYARYFCPVCEEETEHQVIDESNVYGELIAQETICEKCCNYEYDSFEPEHKCGLTNDIF